MARKGDSIVDLHYCFLNLSPLTSQGESWNPRRLVKWQLVGLRTGLAIDGSRDHETATGIV
jgi:hypothetical protein